MPSTLRVQALQPEVQAGPRIDLRLSRAGA